MLYTKEQACAEINALVAHFRANEPSLAYVPEAQIEANYIRKLFRFLNWNTDNEGLSVAEWEFVLQRTDEKGKRPDYILQLDGQHLLVMDAKKVSYDMHDPRWMQQVYAYAYSTQNQPTPGKIDFAVLTDFQEFVLLDCTLYAAEPRVVGNFRVLDWTCDDYVTRFDTLWNLLERENMRAAALTRDTTTAAGLWSMYLSPKKVKANRIPPDKAFLSEMDDEKTGWRVRLARDMKKRNPEADGALITAAVQLLIDRLIFVKALSDREIEIDYLTQLAGQVEQSGLAADDVGWFNACREVFAKLDSFYDGSIFEPRPELEAVTVSNKVVRQVIHDLQPENSPYNFAVLPVEILGTIYERFLGRVVRTTDSRVKIEDKPEVRKVGGVYYTPQYIVDYIVENTVGECLSECKTPADVATLKIVDPACGSGSFLLGAYAALIRWHVAYYGDKKRLPRGDREAAYYDSDGRVRLTAKLKRQILLNNLFGVDIDAQAVEVTRFSLSLKALEDTRRDELAEEKTLFQQTVLPDLRQNIKCGNSLIGPNYFSDQLVPDLEELRRVNPFDWAGKDGFREIMKAGGFDCIIGNPPYVDIKSLPTHDVQHIFSVFPCANNRINLFAAFIEKSFQIAKQQSFRFSMIVPTALLTQESYRVLRKFILEHYQITNIVRLPNESFGGVAGEVKVDTAIVALSGQHPGSSLTEIISYVGYDRITRIDPSVAQVHRHANQASWKSTSESVWSITTSESDDSILTKCEMCSVPLEVCAEFCLGLTPYDKYKGHTPAQIKNQVFHAERKKDDTFRKLLAGNDVMRYHIEWNGTKWISYGPWLGAPREKRFFTQKRILVKQIIDWTSKRIWASVTDEELYNTQNAFNLLAKPGWRLEYLLGVLNSRLMTFYHRKKYLDEFKMRFQKVLIKDCRRFPIRNIDLTDGDDKEKHDAIVERVEKVMDLHRRKAAATSSATEQDCLQRLIDDGDQQIDVLVYQLYGLSAGEIAVVERAVQGDA